MNARTVDTVERGNYYRKINVRTCIIVCPKYSIFKITGNQCTCYFCTPKQLYTLEMKGERNGISEM